MMERFKLGVQQGRLSPRKYPLLQSFPWDSWREEFYLASMLGLSALEWLFVDEKYKENPIWTNPGRKAIFGCVRDTGVAVSSVCAPFFLNSEFYSADSKRRKLFDSVMRKLISYSAELEIQTILLPVLEEASPDSSIKIQILLEYLQDWSGILRSSGIKLGLESDLPAAELATLIRKAPSGVVGAYYDFGNATASGYCTNKEVEELGSFLVGAHIKDRKVNGPSVFLGTGDLDLGIGLDALAQSEWSGCLVFESYFEDDPVGTMSNNIRIVKQLLLKDGQN